ncbi:mechanosensitive ion channel [Zhihengliuella salsuginis]|uniref:Uncharacterized protein n=1 Tax=Zhihengliuella salsuginis TaxID=578222 RepID=A0ABQ3GFW3_9MICC|nr:mechanosensitive ion channel [Zhihengliuella salsuginis]GHD03883.1 hypothetical protein GCM10008096_10520 [Zhihengliuella salsuginis]
MESNFLGDIDWGSMLLKVVFAIVILIVTWIIAKAVKWAISKAVGKIPALQKQGNDGQQVGESIGQIASLLVWLFGLIAILQLFNLDQVLSPLQGLLGGIFGFLPNLIGAAFIFFIGFVIAKIVRQLVQTALGTVDLTKLTSKFKSKDAEPVDPQEANAKVSSLVGNLLFGIIIIVVAIAALQVLGIAAISQPAEQMLSMFLEAIPAIIAAGILLTIGVVIASFLGKLLEELLRGVGTDRAIGGLGVVPAGTSVSGVISKIVQVAIVIFFAIMATQLLGFPAITNILNEILELGGNVLFGGVIIAAGFLIAKLIGKFVTNDLASKVLRYSAIALFVAMGLRYMGLADSIINLAFGAVVIGGALAAALAFGLGGRDAAARTLSKVDLETDTPGATPGGTVPGGTVPGGTAPGGPTTGGNTGGLHSS